VLEPTEMLLGQSQPNFSLCHGMCGNAETLMYAASVLDEPEFSEPVFKLAERGRETVDSRESEQWRTGSPGPEPDPSLMLGTAGIGYFYLRLFSDEVPSCLYPQVSPQLDVSVPEPLGHEAPQRMYVTSYFGKTLTAIDMLEVEEAPTPERSIAESRKTSDALAYNQKLEEYLDGGDDPVRSRLADVAALDRTALEMQQRLDDFTAEVTYSFVSPETEEVDWESEEFVLAPHTDIMTSTWRWGRWLNRVSSDDTTNPSEWPSKGRDAFLLFRAGNRIHVRPVRGFVEEIIRSVDGGATLDEISSNVIGKIKADDVPKEAIFERVVQQMSQMQEAGIIRCRSAHELWENEIRQTLDVAAPS
jgi:hypothetical protein